MVQAFELHVAVNVCQTGKRVAVVCQVASK
jgi:hypothetical protein